MRTNNGLAKEYSVKIMHNTNEARVYEMMEQIMELAEYSEICTCGICLEDIYGITLNSLPPYYKHSLTIDLHRERIQDKQDKEIEIEVVRAIERVRKKPNHS